MEEVNVIELIISHLTFGRWDNLQMIRVKELFVSAIGEMVRHKKLIYGKKKYN